MGIKNEQERSKLNGAVWRISISNETPWAVTSWFMCCLMHEYLKHWVLYWCNVIKRHD